MRKFLSISLLFIYLLSTAGITISLHYCGGNLASLALFESASCCCDGDNQEPKGCCKDEWKSIKITSDQLKVESNSNKVLCYSTDYLPQTNPFTFIHHAYGVVASTPVPIHAPPDVAQGIPVYKRIHSFLFYS